MPDCPISRSAREATRLPNGVTDASPQRRLRQVPVEPDPYCLAHQVLLRHEAHIRVAAVATVITIVAHEEIVASRHDLVVLARLACVDVENPMPDIAKQLLGLLRI